MGVEITRKDNKLKYALIEEEVDKEDILIAKESIKDARQFRKGFSKDGNMRLAIEIPKAILYNYLMINGIKPHEHLRWLKSKKNLKKLKKDFPDFCV